MVTTQNLSYTMECYVRVPGSIDTLMNSIKERSDPIILYIAAIVLVDEPMDAVVENHLTN